MVNTKKFTKCAKGSGCTVLHEEDGIVLIIHVCRNHFGGLFNNDREELDEAVSFLHLQGTYV